MEGTDPAEGAKPLDPHAPPPDPADKIRDPEGPPPSNGQPTHRTTRVSPCAECAEQAEQLEQLRLVVVGLGIAVCLIAAALLIRRGAAS